LSDVQGHLGVLGTATGAQLGHSGFGMPAWKIERPTVGLWTLGFLVFVTVALTVLAWVRNRARLHLAPLFLLTLAVLTSLYRDVEYAYIKRFDFMPLLGVLTAAVVLAELRGRAWRAAVLVLAVALSVREWSLGEAWRKEAATRYPHLDHPLALPH